MHGQKKRRKRLLKGMIETCDPKLCWELLSEPQCSTEHGYQGLWISVKAEDEAHRELILAYPYPKTKTGGPRPLPQRPRFSVTTIESDIQNARKAGWNPLSRGRTFVHFIPEVSRPTRASNSVSARPRRRLREKRESAN
jgi:hypothetical protein